jgi:CRISPR-associated protein Csx17
MASIGTGTNFPILCNINGVELNKGTPTFLGEQRPQRVVWHNGDVVRLLVDILERRLVDTDPAAALPLTAHRFCRADHLSAFLNRALDLDEIKRWIPPLALIDWSKWQPSLYPGQHSGPYARYDGGYLLHALFRPLFYPDMLQIDGNELFPPHLRPRPVLVRRLLNLIRQGEGEEAIQLARSRYLAAGRATVLPPCPLSVDYVRLAASLLIPMRRSAIVTAFSRWLQLSTSTVFASLT